MSDEGFLEARKRAERSRRMDNTEMERKWRMRRKKARVCLEARRRGKLRSKRKVRAF